MTMSNIKTPTTPIGGKYYVSRKFIKKNGDKSQDNVGETYYKRNENSNRNNIKKVFPKYFY
jgi:hypothetical protein